MKLDVEKAQKFYMLGIGGIGMSALARMLKHMGKQVSGSNSEENELLEILSGEGVASVQGQDIAMIPDDIDVIIYSEAVEDYHPELIKNVREKFSVPVLSYPQMLGEVSRGKFTIAIAGTHGKTTTTGMIGSMLVDLGQKPSIIVGSILAREQSNFVPGDSDIFVVESCEYKRSFLNIHPNILVITNIEEDHMDYYDDIDDIYSAFNQLARSVPADGYVVCALQDKAREAVLKGVSAKVVHYQEYIKTDIALRVPAVYNLENAAAALAVADILELSPLVSQTSLENFAGTWRRFQYMGKTSHGTDIYNDYAHHPTEIRSLLAGVRKMFPDKKIVAVFEPHLFSRTKALFNEFATSFSDADLTIITPIYYAREAFDDSISSSMLAETLAVAGTESYAVDSYNEALEKLSKEIDEQSIVFLIGAGPLYRLADRLVV